MKTLFSSLVAGVLAMPSASWAQDQPEVIYVPHQFAIEENGGFLNKTVNEMTKKEFQAALSIICAAAGCATGVTTLLNQGLALANDVMSGGNYFLSGGVIAHYGEEWNFKFDRPEGYAACDAMLLPDVNDMHELTMSEGAFSSGTLYLDNNMNGILSYNVVPKHKLTRQWVVVYFVVKFVRNGFESKYACVPSGTRIWEIGTDGRGVFHGIKRGPDPVPAGFFE